MRLNVYIYSLCSHLLCALIAVNFTEMSDAKEMLVLAETSDEQKMWIQRLLRKIRKKGFVHTKGALHQG